MLIFGPVLLVTVFLLIGSISHVRHFEVPRNLDSFQAKESLKRRNVTLARPIIICTQMES